MKASFLLRVSRAALLMALLPGAPALASATSEPVVPPPIVTAPRTVNGWGMKLTDVTPDPAVRYGMLPNGMKYAIMHNGTPKGTASVRLRFAFGSIGESESERGLAHFIEHMAFEGSTHVPQDEMIKILERQGLAFGADTNAFTGFDTTTYLLDLPQTDPEHIDTALFLFREVSSQLKFSPASVERERGIILSEERSRDNYQLHEMVDQLGFDFPQTPYPNRIPIGLDAVIKRASADALRNLYHRYYRPENATLVIVGDFNPAEVEAKIVKTFSDWKDVGPAAPPLPRGRVDLARPLSFGDFADPALATTVNYTVLRPWKDPGDTLAERRHNIVEALAERMFNRRLQRLANAPGSALIDGRLSLGKERDAALVSSVSILARDGAWKDALAAAEQEVRRAEQFGFTETEFRTASTNMIGEMHSMVQASDTRTNKTLADNILGAEEDRDFVTSPKMMMPVMAVLLKSVSLDEVNAAFRVLWTGSAPLVHLSSKEAVPEKQIAAAFQASRTVALAAPKESSAQAFAYDNFGTPGTVVEDKRIPDLDIRTVRFSNNVRLNIKKTNFESDRIRFLVRMGGGQLDLPKDEPGLGPMMTATSGEAALRKDSLDDLKDLFAGKVIAAGAVVGGDAFIAAGTTVPKDLALQMKVSAAYLTDPGFRPEAANKWAAVVPVIEKQVDAEPERVAVERLPILLASGDQRFGLPPEAELAKRTFAEARAALAPVMTSAPIEITIVGDVDEDAAISAVAGSFGALPKRKLVDMPPPDSLKVAFRADRSPIVLTHDGPAGKAVVESIWPTTDDSDFRQMMGMQVLGQVLENMLIDSIRLKLGDTYAPSVQSNMSHTFKGFGYFSVAAVVAPDKADEVQKAIADTVAQVRDKPITDDMLARARNPDLENIDKSLRENSFWIAALQKAQSEPALLDRFRQRKQVLQSLTADELRQLARKFLQPDRVQLVRIVSSKLSTVTASK